MAVIFWPAGMWMCMGIWIWNRDGAGYGYGLLDVAVAQVAS